jgi:hypothetical protein
VHSKIDGKIVVDDAEGKPFGEIEKRDPRELPP